MRESMRYITVEEREQQEKLAKLHDIKGYSLSTSLMCKRNDFEFNKLFPIKVENQEIMKWIK